MYRQLFLLLLTLLFLSGCATFKGKELEPVYQNDIPKSETKPSLEISFEFEQYMNGAKTQLFKESAENSLRSEFVSIARASDSFSEVSTNVHSPDLKMTVLMKDEGHGNMGMAVITGLSFYIIPSWATDNWVIEADIKNSEGEKWAVKLEDYTTMWQHILLVPVMPFKLTPVVVDDVQDNMFRTLILRMHEKGIIEPQKSKDA